MGIRKSWGSLEEDGNWEGRVKRRNAKLKRISKVIEGSSTTKKTHSIRVCRSDSEHLWREGGKLNGKVFGIGGNSSLEGKTHLVVWREILTSTGAREGERDLVRTTERKTRRDTSEKYEGTPQTLRGEGRNHKTSPNGGRKGKNEREKERDVVGGGGGGGGGGIRTEAVQLKESLPLINFKWHLTDQKKNKTASLKKKRLFEMNVPTQGTQTR